MIQDRRFYSKKPLDCIKSMGCLAHFCRASNPVRDSVILSHIFNLTTQKEIIKSW